MGVPSSGNVVTSILVNDIKEVGKAKFLTKALDDGQFMGFPLQHAERWLKNNSRLLTAIKQSLRSAHATGSIYQMRVTLGSFVFDRWQHPKNAGAGYSVDEFENMLCHEMSRCHIMRG